jgi:ribosomal protein L29
MADSSTPEDEATLSQLQERLTIYRRNLANFLKQKALSGGNAYVRPDIFNGIDEARHEIARLKTLLRERGIPVEDNPDDTESPMREQPHPHPPCPPSPEEPIHSSNSTHPPAPLPYLEEYLTCFSADEASGEDKILSSFFVPPAWFKALVGNPDVGDSWIVFGERGYGKTAVCLSIAENLRNKILPVVFNAFDELDANEEGDIISLDKWLQAVRKKLLDILHKKMQKHGSHRKKIGGNAENSRIFWAIYYISGIEQTIIVSQPDNAMSLVQRYQEMPPLEWFNMLGYLIRRAGFKSVYLLIDGIKEQHKDRLRILAPLLDNRANLHQSSFSLRFFLPSSFEQELKQHWKQDIPLTDKIIWSDRHLREMLSRRLQLQRKPARRNTKAAKIECFADLCAPDLGFDADELLVRAAQGSPRRLIRLARKIISHHSHHCRPDNLTDRITAETIETVIQNQKSDWWI